jgi:cytochrome c peroxidase
MSALTNRFRSLYQDVFMNLWRFATTPTRQRRAGSSRSLAMLITLLAIAGWAAVSHRSSAAEPKADEQMFSNPSGIHHTFTIGEAIESSNNPFFQDLGTNGRSCFTCHRPAQAWTITPPELADRFDRTSGLDPIFRSNDGANCEGADVSTVSKRRQAFSLLLTRGVIRIGIEVPAGAEFEIVDVDDPYHCGALFTSPSMYRRPLPTTNLAFLSTVMWDGRETAPRQAIRGDLISQALHAVTSHAQGAAPSAAQLQAIVDFELGLFTAQAGAHSAGTLGASGAHGGPAAVARQPFCIGINDPLDMLPDTPGACATSSGGLDPIVFTLFGAWTTAGSPQRQAIARGEALFNTRRFVIDEVPGLNGGSQDPVPGPIQQATCTICHDTPNAGNHSISMPLNIGVADASRRSPDLPLYTLRNRTTGKIVQTSDPGRAMVTGRWNDISKFKGPVLRALAARGPYFHDGSAANLAEVIAFYDTRFRIGLTNRERADLIAFLEAL